MEKISTTELQWLKYEKQKTFDYFAILFVLYRKPVHQGLNYGRNILKKRSLWQATFMDQRNFSKIKTGKFGSKEENRNDFLVTSFVHVELLQI